MHLELPAEAVRSNQPLTVGQFVITVDPGTVSMSGTLTAAVDEAAVRSTQAYTLQFSLSGDAWQPSVGLDDGASLALIQGLTSAQSEAFGWNSMVQPMLSSSDLTRVDDTTVLLTVQQFAGYDISSPETLTLTVPPSATLAAHSIVASELVVLHPVAGSGRTTGDLMTKGTDASIQSAGGESSGIALGLLWECGGVAMGLRWDCDGIAVWLLWDCYGVAP